MPAGMAHARTRNSGGAWKVAFSPDGALLLTGTHGGLLNLWSVEEGRIRTTLVTKGRFIVAVAYVRGCQPLRASVRLRALIGQSCGGQARCDGNDAPR